jgi:hypothetical protein
MKIFPDSMLLKLELDISMLMKSLGVEPDGVDRGPRGLDVLDSSNEVLGLFLFLSVLWLISRYSVAPMSAFA